MAIICRSHGLLFIQAPRTGCTAVARVLKERFSGEQLPAEDILDEQGAFKVPRKHCSVKQLLSEGLIATDYASKWLVFTAVRNPFDSLASLYVKKRDRYQPLLGDKNSWIYKVPGYVDDMHFCRTHSFEQWLLRHYTINKVQRFLGRGKRSLHRRYTDGVHRVIRFERLQQDFESVIQEVGIAAEAVVPNYNATPQRRADYRTYYTSSTRELVEYVFSEDLERYGYTFDGVRGEPAPELEVRR